MFTWLKNKLARLAKRTTLDKPRKTKLDGQLTAKIGAAGWPAQVKQLSAKKVRIVVGRWQKMGSAVALTLCNKRSGFSCAVKGTVIQVVMRSDKLWDMRCILDQPLNADEFATLVQA